MNAKTNTQKQNENTRRARAAHKAAATKRANKVSARQRTAAYKAWETRRANAVSERQRQAAYKAWGTRRAKDAEINSSYDNLFAAISSCVA